MKTKNLILYLISGLLFAGFLAIAILVACKHVFWLDKFNVLVAKHRAVSATKFFKIFTYFGSFYVLAAIALLCLILFKNKKNGLFVVANLAICALISTVVKFVVRRARPLLAIVKETGFSFPSAHAMLSVAVYAVLIYFAFKFLKSKPLKTIIAILLCAIIFVVAFSRAYLGVHFVSDLVAGALLGLAVTIFNITIFNKLQKQTQNKT